MLKNVKLYLVCSQKLKKIYDNFEKKPSNVISDGVDLELFKMTNVMKGTRNEKNFKIYGTY